MANIGIAEAFRRLGATLKNVQWSVSAFNDSGELVVSIWEHHRDKSMEGRLVFSDRFDRWKGPGNNEFRKNIATAYETNTDLRLIIVATRDTELVQNGVDASTVKKSFRVRQDLVGKVLKIDGENYSIEFKAV